MEVRIASEPENVLVMGSRVSDNPVSYILLLPTAHGIAWQSVTFYVLQRGMRSARMRLMDIGTLEAIPNVALSSRSCYSWCYCD